MNAGGFDTLQGVIWRPVHKLSIIIYIFVFVKLLKEALSLLFADRFGQYIVVNFTKDVIISFGKNIKQAFQNA